MFTINPTLSVKKLHISFFSFSSFSISLSPSPIHKRNLKSLTHFQPLTTSNLQKSLNFELTCLFFNMPSDFSESRRMPKIPHGGGVGIPAEQQEQLPCPRCDSANTKFCYYNNYNFSQPRHFCKSCRRYWTHGGTLRDIPVGGVSRKSSKRSRTCSSAAVTTVVGSRNFPLQATPVIFPQSSNNSVSMAAKGSASSLYGGFTSLLNYNVAARNGPGVGFNGPDGFGLGLGHGSYFEDVRFAQGITVWPFSTGATDAATTTTTSHVAQIPATWQFEGQESKVGFVSGDHHYLA